MPYKFTPLALLSEIRFVIKKDLDRYQKLKFICRTGGQGSDYEVLTPNLTGLDKLNNHQDVYDKFLELLKLYAEKNPVGPKFFLKKINPLEKQS